MNWSELLVPAMVGSTVSSCTAVIHRDDMHDVGSCRNDVSREAQHKDSSRMIDTRKERNAFHQSKQHAEMLTRQSHVHRSFERLHRTVE
jgi:hypothetical protein